MKIPLCQSLAITRVDEAATASRMSSQFTPKTWFSAISRAEINRVGIIREDFDDRRAEMAVCLRTVILLRVVFSPIN